MGDTFDADGMDEGNSNEYQECDKMNEIISTMLLKQVEELINGGKIEKIETDEQLANIVDLGKRAKKIRLDTVTEGKAYTDKLYRPYKEAISFVKTKVDALERLEANIALVTGNYQAEKMRIAREAQEKADREAEEKRRELALAEQKHIEEEEALRVEAEKKYAAGDIEGGNTATECANIAIQEACKIEEQIHEVEAVPVATVFKPAGLSVKTKLVARVSDYRQAMKWLVDNNEWGYLEGSAFRGLVDSAVKKIADRASDKESFKVAGASVTETTIGKF
jgi:flagellar basal body rod protein FlgB